MLTEFIMKSFLQEIGLRQRQHVICHSSFRKIKAAFPGISVEDFIKEIQTILTKEGSLIIPAFTYCYKKSYGSSEIFNREKTKTILGAVPETFRKMPEVKRTSSPTHSFSIWGKVTEEIKKDNSPESPLGAGSPLEWLAKQENRFLLLVGVNFTSNSFCHYIETVTPVPWADYSPWEYMGVKKIGISEKGEQHLKELPGCSQSFKSFEEYLIQEKLIHPFIHNDLKSYFIPIKILLTEGIKYFKENPESLLCSKGNCKACDSRRSKFIEQ